MWIVLLLGFIPIQLLASDLIELNEVDFMNAGSVQLNEDLATAQFSVEETTSGVQTSYLLDFDSGTWTSWDSGGNAFSGQLPPDMTPEWAIPCFAGPWAFAGCLVGIGAGGALGGWYCERRDSTAFARAQAACGLAGIESFNAGICGANSSFTCRPLDAYH